MSKNNNSTMGVQQQTSGMYYYPQYSAYPYSYSYGTQSTQPISVGVNSNNKKEGSSTGLTVLKVIATLLLIALTVGIGVLAWKSYKKADKTMDKANERLDEAKNTMNKANDVLDKTKDNQQQINDIFAGKKDVVINNKSYTVGLKDLATAQEQSVGS